jgi:diguanylate cyclase (GGDEF)-like protein/PAS domain S-box-containing protein
VSEQQPTIELAVSARSGLDATPALGVLFDSNPLPMWIYDIATLGFLAVNDAAIEQYGYSREEFLAMTIADIRPPEDVPALLANVRRVSDYIDHAGVWRHRRKDDSQIHVEITSHPLTCAGRAAELVIAYDVSARVAAESELCRLLELESLISDISRQLSDDDSLDAAIGWALAEMGKFSAAGRAYLFRFDDVGLTMSNTHEWCAAGVAAQRDSLQQMPLAAFDWSMGQLRDGHTLPIPDVSALPPTAACERETLERQGVRSLIMVPVHGSSGVCGFVGFDNVVAAEPWSPAALRLLEVGAELIGSAVQRRHDQRELQSALRQLDSIVQSAHHFAFYRLAIDHAAEHRARVEFASDSLRRVAGIDPAADFESWFASVHPDDLPALKAANAEAAEQGSPLDITIRMFNPVLDAWRWIRAVSNPVCDQAGNLTHYNGFLLDVSEMQDTAQALQAERDFADAVMDTVGALVIVLDRDGRIVRFNRACERVTGYRFEEVKGRSVWDFLVVPQDRDVVERVFVRLVDGGGDSQFENHWLTKDGREVLIAWSNTSIRDADGRLLYGIGTGIDITERKRAELALRKLSSAVDQTASGIIIVDQDGNVEYVNPAYAQISGFSEEELLGRPAGFLGTPQRHTFEQQRIWQHLESGENWRGEVAQVNRSGERCWALVTVSPVRSPDSQATHYAALIEDVTELKRAHESLERLASFDTLTGLPNRRLFRDRLEQAVKHTARESNPVAVLYLDLDNFKRVNDSLGHDVGDALLREVAERLLNCVRETDTVARLGGDEFVILLDTASTQRGVETVAHKILRELSAPIVAGGHEVVVTTSIGITLAPSDSTDAGTLLRNADLAMYRAKERGKDRIAYFEQSMDEEVSHRLNLEAELRRALDAGQIEPYFQPIVRLSDLQIVGFEALARWRHPDKGFIPPGDFVPVAEECGLIIPLGEQLLERAAREMQRLRAAHQTELYVSVNLSTYQARTVKLAEVIGRILERTGLPADALRLEITESLLMADFNAARKLLNRLKEELNTRVAIDDFGTGYSSLSYLKQLPVDTLKIDRSFVRDIPGDQNDVEITAAIIAMGQALQKDIVAEGVESADQVAFLRDRGCRYAQGFLLGLPCPPADYLEHPLRIALPGPSAADD